MSDVNTKARTMPQPSGANTHLFFLHWLMAHPAQLWHQLWPESLAWFQHNGKVHTDLKCTVVRCCTVNFLISGFLFGLWLLWLLHPSKTKLLFIHHHVIIMSSSFHPWNLTGGSSATNSGPNFATVFFGKFAKLLFHFLIATLPCQIHCCVATPVDGGWTNVSISTCIDQGLDDPGVASLLRRRRHRVGRYDFGAISGCHFYCKDLPQKN